MLVPRLPQSRPPFLHPPPLYQPPPLPAYFFSNDGKAVEGRVEGSESEGNRATVTLSKSQASADTTAPFPTVRPGPLGPWAYCLAAFCKVWPGQPHPAFSPHPAILATQKFLPHPACSRKVNRASREGLYCVLALLALALETTDGSLIYKWPRSINRKVSTEALLNFN